MRTPRSYRSLGPFCFYFAILFAMPLAADSDDLNIEARLIWGTNDTKSPDPKHKIIDTPLSKKLGTLFSWKNYFEVNRQRAAIRLRDSKQMEMSKKCVIQVKNLGRSRVEVKLFGAGRFANKTTEAIPSGGWLVIAGESENGTAWFVVIKSVGAAKGSSR